MHADIKSVLYSGSRDELNAKLFERDKRIAELEFELHSAATAIESAYGKLPTDKFPGPPTSIVEHMRAVARRQS